MKKHRNCPKYGTLAYTIMEIQKKSAYRILIDIGNTISYYTEFVYAMETHKPDYDLTIEKEYLEISEKLHEKLSKQLLRHPCF